ncbi:DUF6551 family protein [Scatolibacter rhodanostii]|uniref:DUF6551 family protein n=1 Tax=Scatolibacter rhodanostii TaxID=2014781 RepID=UPI000C071DA0|nr:DUF6551 family protein [Scatolibacter rhodanostii]
MKNQRKPALAGQVHFTMPYERKQLPTGILFSGQPYQRKVKTARVKQIIDEFDPKLLDEVIVSFRDGRYNVVDGQHRIAALKLMNGGTDIMVNCKIANGLTYEQEADLYERLDASKKKLNLADKTRAKSEARNDPDILEIHRILSSYGIRWSFAAAGNGSANNKIISARAVINAYKLLGGTGFERMVKLLKQTWKGDKDSLNAYILSGVALFVKTYESDFKDSIFVKKLSRVQPQEIVSLGRTDISTRDAALKFARVIRNKYNGQSKENTLSYKFNG